MYLSLEHRVKTGPRTIRTDAWLREKNRRYHEDGTYVRELGTKYPTPVAEIEDLDLIWGVSYIV